MELKRSDYLLNQFKENKLTAFETEEFLLFLQEDDREDVLEEISFLLDNDPKIENYKSKKWAIMLSNILSVDKVINAKREKKILSIRISRLLYAASIFFFLSVGIWFFNNHYSKSHNENVTINHKTAANKGKVFLMLSDGEKIDIEAKANGIIIKNQQYQIIKIQDSILKVSALTSQTDFKNNIIGVVTLKGAKFQVIMSDQTKVWLNASSSIYFSSSCGENKRINKMSGEVYFEVASLYESTTHKKVPFLVKIIKKNAKKQTNETVEVLGTHFNINAYADEKATIATLLEGSVKVHLFGKSSQKALLKPGEQAILTGEKIKIEQADTISAIAWKNNLFRFKDNDIHSIMRQLARWYNVDVIYDKDLDDERLTGFISTSLSLSKTLKTLSAVSNFSFKLENQVIIVNQNKR